MSFKSMIVDTMKVLFGKRSLNSQWLALRIGGANFLHCWFANSIWLERAESLIIKR